jgi:hypothetical protein
MGVAEQLAMARDLLERAQRTPEDERLWLLTIAWSQLHEAAEALAEALADGPAASVAGRESGGLAAPPARHRP